MTKKEKMQEENQELKVSMLECIDMSHHHIVVTLFSTCPPPPQRLRAENDYLHLRLNELEKVSSDVYFFALFACCNGV